MSELIVRCARKEDGPVLEKLWAEFLEEQTQFDPRMGCAVDAVERWKNDFPLWLRSDERRMFVAERFGRTIGFTSAQIWWPPPIYAPVMEAYITEIYVVPAERLTAVGSLLINAVKAWAGEFDVVRLRLNVLDANEEGLHFWTKMKAQPFSTTLTIELGRRGLDTQEIIKPKFGF